MTCLNNTPNDSGRSRIVTFFQNFTLVYPPFQPITLQTLFNSCSSSAQPYRLSLCTRTPSPPCLTMVKAPAQIAYVWPNISSLAFVKWLHSLLQTRSDVYRLLFQHCTLRNHDHASLFIFQLVQKVGIYACLVSTTS